MTNRKMSKARRRLDRPKISCLSDYSMLQYLQNHVGCHGTTRIVNEDGCMIRACRGQTGTAQQHTRRNTKLYPVEKGNHLYDEKDASLSQSLKFQGSSLPQLRTFHPEFTQEQYDAWLDQEHTFMICGRHTQPLPFVFALESLNHTGQRFTREMFVKALQALFTSSGRGSERNRINDSMQESFKEILSMVEDLPEAELVSLLDTYDNLYDPVNVDELQNSIEPIKQRLREFLHGGYKQAYVRRSSVAPSKERVQDQRTGAVAGEKIAKAGMMNAQQILKAPGEMDDLGILRDQYLQSQADLKAIEVENSQKRVIAELNETVKTSLLA
jgi:hypothetical protein